MLVQTLVICYFISTKGKEYATAAYDASDATVQGADICKRASGADCKFEYCRPAHTKRDPKK